MNDPVDFAVVLLQPNEVANLSARTLFIPEGAIEGPMAEDLSDDFGVFGFLGHHNEVDTVNGTLEANAVEFPAKKTHKFQTRQTRAHPTWYLPLMFEPGEIKKSLPPNFDIRRLGGMSGGPIFRYSNDGLRSLAGIAIEHHPSRKRQVLLGLRSCVIRNLLTRWWPKIGQSASSNASTLPQGSNIHSTSSSA
ncbi:MAG: hypothetical protein U1A53_18155 [Prosthecobacter sp.]|nr:hypothetical protein [Prosthecobacter sp.]